jgi:subtilisin
MPTNRSGETAATVRQILQTTAKNLGNSSYFGHGLVQAMAAVEAGGTGGGGSGGGASVENPPGEGLLALSVASINYASSGGPNGDRHLKITVQLDPEIAGAVVSIDLFRDGLQQYGSGSGTTGTGGSITFEAKNIPSGTYNTVVTQVSAAGYDWDKYIPPNSWTK